jgi:hypothetical protein
MLMPSPRHAKSPFASPRQVAFYFVMLSAAKHLDARADGLHALLALTRPNPSARKMLRPAASA